MVKRVSILMLFDLGEQRGSFLDSTLGKVEAGEIDLAGLARGSYLDREEVAAFGLFEPAESAIGNAEIRPSLSKFGIEFERLGEIVDRELDLSFRDQISAEVVVVMREGAFVADSLDGAVPFLLARQKVDFEMCIVELDFDEHMLISKDGFAAPIPTRDFNDLLEMSVQSQVTCHRDVEESETETVSALGVESLHRGLSLLTVVRDTENVGIEDRFDQSQHAVVGIASASDVTNEELGHLAVETQDVDLFDSADGNDWRRGCGKQESCDQ